jgi:K+-sensing histidine kinase KdpD
MHNPTPTARKPERRSSGGIAPHSNPAYIRYGLAVVLSAIALGITVAQSELFERTVYLLFFIAVGISAWYGGFGPGLLAALIGLLSADYFIVPPLGSFGPFTAREMVAPVLFVLVAAMLSGFSDSLRAARSRAEARELEALELAQQLEEQALELEVQVEETQTMNVALEEQADTARRAREQAETANTAKMQFLTMMSHELRTPLNAIAGYTELLALGVHGPVNGQQREDLKRIQDNQKHLLGVINDI